MVLAVSLYLLLSLSLPNSLRVLQWNAGSLRARRTKLLHFISSHPVDHIYIQDSNLNLFSSFWIPGFSALQSRGTHSRSGIFSTDVADASGGVIIFVKQGLFFSELSTSSLSSFGPYSDYVEVNISLNNFSSLSFLNVYASPIRSSTKDSRTNSFLSPFFPSMWKRKRSIFRVSASASSSTEKVPLPLPHPCLRHCIVFAALQYSLKKAMHQDAKLTFQKALKIDCTSEASDVHMKAVTSSQQAFTKVFKPGKTKQIV